MKKVIMLSVMMLTTASLILAAGYKVGDKVEDFNLKNIDGKYVSLSDYPDAKGFIVAFTCNGCPYAQAYQDRLIGLDKKFKSKGYPVIAINPNDVGQAPDDALESMKERADSKGYTFPYLKDASQDVYRAFGAERTPHMFVLTRSGDELVVSYVGAIDDNYQDASAVQNPYVANAVNALLMGHQPEVTFTKAIGCGIKAQR